MDEMTWIRSDVRQPTAEEIATDRVFAWLPSAKAIEWIDLDDLPLFPERYPFWFLVTDPTAATVQAVDGDQS